MGAKAPVHGLTARGTAGGVGGDPLLGGTSAHNGMLDIQRARILGAMVEVCAERGAGNVTVAHIVERAGVSRRTFYELFKDREECFLAAFDDGFARASKYVRESYDPASPWLRRVRLALACLLSFLDAEPGMGELLIVGSLGAGHNALQRRRRGIAQIIVVVDEGRTVSKAGAGLPPLTAEGVVGGVLSVLHSRLSAHSTEPLTALTGPLMGTIVLPYLGPAAARRELSLPLPIARAAPPRAERNPLGGLEMRLTYRTVRVLIAIAAHPGSSNRALAAAAEVTDQGQMSKLLARLQQIGLIENTGGGATRGEPNAWTLTERGWRVQGAISEQAGGGRG